jgi:hypothetical protein
MNLDERIKKLIEKISFLSYDEKENLISWLSRLDNSKKEKLFDFLAIEEAKVASVQSKYASIFQTTYQKHQNTFNKISQLIK